ncbi:MAG TPA: GNAT family N-acetyltransferase [Verrucomicrobiae bacterium]
MNHPAPQIFPATEADLPAIARLAEVIWRAHYPGIISTAQIDFMLAKMYALDELREEILLHAIRYDRLFVGEEFVGFASYGPTVQRTTFKLHKLYLHPEWHGRGLGSLLLSHCEREVSKLGAHCLLLAVNKQNSKAIAAYKRNGFAIKESVVVDIGGGFVMDDYIMAKALSQTSSANHQIDGIATNQQ